MCVPGEHFLTSRNAKQQDIYNRLVCQMYLTSYRHHCMSCNQYNDARACWIILVFAGGPPHVGVNPWNKNFCMVKCSFHNYITILCLIHCVKMLFCCVGKYFVVLFGYANNIYWCQRKVSKMIRVHPLGIRGITKIHSKEPCSKFKKSVFFYFLSKYFQAF